MYRYYSEELLNDLMYSLHPIPEVYTVNYEGLTMSVPFDEVKTLLGIDSGKTFSKCYKDLDKLCDDLGFMRNTQVTYSLHAKWLWFNFKGDFVGYADERAKKARAEHKAWRIKYEEELKDKLAAERLSIQDGTYGLYSKDEGGVYLLSCGDYFKIGYSKNIKSRLSSIRTSNPMEVVLVVKYSPHNKKYAQLESKLHEKFKESRHLLEWFKKDFTEEDFIQACVDFCKTAP